MCLTNKMLSGIAAGGELVRWQINVFVDPTAFLSDWLP